MAMHILLTENTFPAVSLIDDRAIFFRIELDQYVMTIGDRVHF
jgi:hypothetical protein